MSTAPSCPACNTPGSLHSHCGEDKACTWLRCKVRECRAVVDLVNRRGFRYLSGGGSERVTFPEAA